MKTRRRALPAPPLVLKRILARLCAHDADAQRLLRLGRFLEGERLLTDGGVKKLAEGLRSNNGFVSLTVDDVRSWGQALTVLLWQSREESWPALQADYFATYDRGKPRRPTRIQRLLLDWSPERDVAGLFQACLRAPDIIGQVREALAYPSEEPAPGRALAASLEALEQESAAPWVASYGADPQARPHLLAILPHLTSPAYAERLEWLACRLESSPTESEAAILRAGRPPRLDPKLRLDPEQLAARLLAERAWWHLERTPGAPEPPILGLLWAVAPRDAETVRRLDGLLCPDSRWRQVGYGADRLNAWWCELLASFTGPDGR